MNRQSATWQEHWFEHNQLLSRVFFDNEVAIYYGSDAHLFAIFHTTNGRTTQKQFINK